MDIWEFIDEKLSASVPVMLLYVLQSEGSSPGRKGFKLALASDSQFCGTIGGGIMEHKLVEKAKSMLRSNASNVEILMQYHDKDHGSNQSGMICSGKQLIAFMPLFESDKKTIEQLMKLEYKTLELSPRGLNILNENALGLNFISDKEWKYTEAISHQSVIHIVGGGHVGLALSELMHFLGFYVKIYDDRPDLNTIIKNRFINEHIILTSYDQLDDKISESDNDYAVIMTVGYRTDKIALIQLLKKSFFYLGLLGSENKIKTLMQEMLGLGYSESDLKKIYSPIGLNIHSKTTQEIAISIAAEIILIKNQNSPSARKSN